MSKKISKEDLKTPDAFIQTSDRVAKTISEKRQPILIAIAIAVFAGVLFVGIQWYQERQEMTAQAEIYEVASALEERQQKVSEERLGEDEAKPEDGEKQEQVAQDTEAADEAPDLEPVDFAKEFAPIVEQYRKVLDQHQGTKAALIASLDLGSFLVSHEQYEEAASVLQAAEKSAKADSLLGVLSQAQLASVLSKQGQTDEAIAELQDLLDNKQADFLHANAILQLGVLYEQKQNFDMAREMYTRASNEYADTQAGQTAKSYLRLLNLKNKGAQQTAQEG